MDASEFYVPMRASWEQILYDTVEEYLAELTAAGLLRKEKIGVCHFFVNEPLYAIFTQRKS
jgi:hypothetical protein